MINTKTTYNLGIVGSRHYNNYEEFTTVTNQIINKFGIPENIISGGHLDKGGNIKPGADTLAWKYATDHKINIIEHDALWDKYGKAAGPIRNKLIVDDSNIILAFLSPDSVGTKNTISLAQKNPNIKIFICNVQ